MCFARKDKNEFDMNYRIYKDEHCVEFVEWLKNKFEYKETKKCVELVGVNSCVCELIASTMFMSAEWVSDNKVCSAIVTAMCGII